MSEPRYGVVHRLDRRRLGNARPAQQDHRDPERAAAAILP